MPFTVHPDSSGATDRSVAEALLQLLSNHGVEHVYGLPGVHNLAFWDSSTGPQIIGVRHEQTAGYAADGFARATGRLGVALTTTGPGAMNIVAAFGEAAVSHSSVIVIASDVSTALRRDEPRGILHEMRDQAAAFAPLATQTLDGPMAWNCVTAEEAIERLAGALAHQAHFGEVAAYIGVPTDVLSQRTSYGITSQMRTAGALETSAWTDEVNAAQRPLVWVGGGAAALCDRPNGEALLRDFVERIGAPVVASFAARGVLSGHAQLVEAPVHEPEVNALLAQCDCLIVLGSDFDGMNTRNWRLPMPSSVVTLNQSAPTCLTQFTCVPILALSNNSRQRSSRRQRGATHKELPRPCELACAVTNAAKQGCALLMPSNRPGLQMLRSSSTCVSLATGSLVTQSSHVLDGLPTQSVGELSVSHCPLPLVQRVQAYQHWQSAEMVAQCSRSANSPRTSKNDFPSRCS